MCSPIDALLADGSHAHRFGGGGPDILAGSPRRPVARICLRCGAREADEIAARFPKLLRRVGGYNIDSLMPGKNDLNLAHILVGSEGTLGFSRAIELKLSPLLGRRAVGACHFGSFHEAMAAAQHIVKLAPIAVELVDATMVALAREIDMFRPTLEAFVRGTPQALLLVEFADPEWDENLRRLKSLHDLIGSLGFDWSRSGAKWGGVVDVLDPRLQGAITELRTAGLNIMMSMKDAGKPMSFVEDCAVPLEHLADYTARLTEVFESNGTTATWYAHASVGCLHVRPILDLPLDKDVKAMRAIAEQAFAFVREYKGSHSGEHGDGSCVRSSTRRCSGRGSRARSRRSRSVSIRTGCSIPARSCVRRSSTTAATSATRRATPRRSGTPISTGRPTPVPAAVSRARSRCATTTAPAARSPVP